MAEENPIVNCHTHIFTGDHVPPYIAKTFLPFGIYQLLDLRLIVRYFRWWNNVPAKIKYQAWYKKVQNIYRGFLILLHRTGPLAGIVELYIFIQALVLCYGFLKPYLPDSFSVAAATIDQYLEKFSPWFWHLHSPILSVMIILLMAVFFKSFRNLVYFILKMIFKFLSLLPGKETKAMVGRYLNIGRYAFHKKQTTILSTLRAQYPSETKIIVLPMDMEYMAAGKNPIRYRDQMAELMKIKTTSVHSHVVLPFVFIDPRRMVPVSQEIRSENGDKDFFRWSQKEEQVVLGNCFIKDYIEDYQFSGFKIYPALGYYPFDDELLPLWKYAADHQVPIQTHCIRGTIFYRGSKKAAWNQHPLFEQSTGKSVVEDYDHSDDHSSDDLPGKNIAEARQMVYEPLVLPQRKNIDFSVNFTHPLNYLGLLHEPYLRQLVGNAFPKNEEKRIALQTLYGYQGMDQPMLRNLSQLKICLAHFGGADEWNRFFEKDRFSLSSQLIKNPDRGINFFTDRNGHILKGKMEQLWKYTDWYSIICSLMLQYENVYADISYILHDDHAILPLLQSSLRNPGLRTKILYGTDFFVVRNHKSDKNMLSDMTADLSPDDFDQIARKNPVGFLKTV